MFIRHQKDEKIEKQIQMSKMCWQGERTDWQNEKCKADSLHQLKATEGLPCAF